MSPSPAGGFPAVRADLEGEDPGLVRAAPGRASIPIPLPTVVDYRSSEADSRARAHGSGFLRPSRMAMVTKMALLAYGLGVPVVRGAAEPL
jgi:hypothetical protein